MKESALHLPFDSTSLTIPTVHKQHEGLLGPATQSFRHEEPRVVFVRVNNRWHFLLHDQNGNHLVRDCGWSHIGAVIYYAACEYRDVDLVETEELLSDKGLEKGGFMRDVYCDEEAIRWKGHVLNREF